MQLNLTIAQEAQLEKIARRDGRSAAELLREEALRLLDEDEDFRLAVAEGRDAALRGEFIEEEEMDRRFQEMIARR